MRLPSFNELYDEQRNVFLRNPDDSILVVGPPGSGKTSTALWKASILAGPAYNRRVVLVTKNRLLAALATQISQDQGGQPVESVTMATFLAQAYWGRFGQYVPQWSPFNYIWEQIIEAYGAAGVQPEIDHLLIDEGQNLPVQFFVWARRFMARAVSVFADEDQTTDGGGCQVAQLRDAGFTEVLPLTINHRNTQEIANLVEHFHVNRTLPPLPARRGRSGEAPRLVSLADWGTLAHAVATRYRNRGGSIGVIVYLKADVERLHELISGLLGDVRVDRYTSDAHPGAEDAIRMRDPGVTVLSSESAIGLEFDTVFVQDLCRSLPMRSMIDYRRMYMLCARARDTLVLVNGPVALDGAQLAALPPPPTLER
jgi:superfamily I DNA/RNA helicase